MIFAIFDWNFNPTEPFVNPGQGVTSAFGVGLFVVMWNYLGWDGVSTIAGEMVNPRRDYPRMLMISVPLITACYFLPTFFGLASVGTEQVEWTAGAFTQIAEDVGGSWLGSFMAIAALVAAAGLFSSLLLSISRVPFVMGEDGYLPKVLMKLHPKYGTPWVSLVGSSAIYSVFILGPFQSLVVVDVTIYAAALMLQFAALIALRIKEPDMERPFRIKGGWWGILLITALPLGVIVLAVYYQAYYEGWQGSIGAGRAGADHRPSPLPPHEGPAPAPGLRRRHRPDARVPRGDARCLTTRRTGTTRSSSPSWTPASTSCWPPSTAPTPRSWPWPTPTG